MLYAGVGVGLAATVGFFGAHLWVKFLKLPPPARRGPAAKDHDFGWEDQVEEWGDLHLERGTDPCLGWWIRALIWSAWVPEHWQAGQVAVDPNHTPRTASWLIPPTPCPRRCLSIFLHALTQFPGISNGELSSPPMSKNRVSDR
jgi:hypothetical protein